MTWLARITIISHIETNNALEQDEMTNTFIVEVFTAKETKIVFVKAADRAKAIKAGNAEVADAKVKPSFGRRLSDITADDMIAEGKYKIIDARNKAPVIATVESRKRLAILVGM